MENSVFAANGIAFPCLLRWILHPADVSLTQRTSSKSLLAMTTDQEKLQKLFEAALREADPKPPVAQETQPDTGGTGAAASAVADVGMAKPKEVEASSGSQIAVPAVHIDAEASAELAALLDEQHLRKTRRRRREAIVTLLVLAGSLLGGAIWFSSDAQRVQALQEAWRDIHTVTDARALAAKYQDALKRISARSSQVDQATSAMGVDPSSGGANHSLDAEMKTFTGGEATPMERADILKKKLSNLGESVGTPVNSPEGTPSR